MIDFSKSEFSYGDIEIDNVANAQRLEKNKEFLEKRIGTLKLHKFSSEEKMLESIKEATKRLLTSNDKIISDITTLVVVGQTRHEGLVPHLSAKVHKELGCNEECLTMDIGQGCTGFIVGLDTVGSYIKQKGGIGLLITADPYRTSINDDDKTTSLLFSDAVSTTLVGNNIKGYTAMDIEHRTHSNELESIIERKNGFLNMNGRSVMNYGKNVVAKILIQYIDKLKKCTDNILVVAHHGSKAIIDTLSMSTDKNIHILWDDKYEGNTISSSIPIIIANQNQTLVKQKKFVIIGFGVGLSTSIATIKTQDEQLDRETI